MNHEDVAGDPINIHCKSRICSPCYYLLIKYFYSSDVSFACQLMYWVEVPDERYPNLLINFLRSKLELIPNAEFYGPIREYSSEILDNTSIFIDLFPSFI